MKYMIGILASFSSLSLQAQTIASNEIKEVQVFLNGAQVHRNVVAQLDAGLSELRVKGLATQINANSIRVSTAPDVIILGVKHELNYIQPNQTKTAELLKQKEILKDDLAIVQHQNNLLQMEKNLLQKNQVQIVGIQNIGNKLEDLKTLIEYQKTSLKLILPKIYELEKKEKNILLEIEKIDRQMASLHQDNKKPSSELIISIQTRKAGTYHFDLNYYVYESGWQMAYDVHVKDIQSPMDIIYRATVFQNTGEDWNNVRLKLSSANPVEGGDRPTLLPWYLRNQPPVIAYNRNDKARIQNAPAAEARMEDSGVMDYMTEQDQITSRNFTIDLPYTIVSNNKPIKVEIKKATIPAKFIYYAVPKLDQDAFLTAEITEWEELNLMDGEAQLFFEGTFQGTVFLNTHNIQDFLRLSLGRDKNIVIERNKIKDYSKNKFLSDKKEISKGYEIIIKNKKNVAMEIIMEDQLPLSTTKEIKVEAEELSGAKYNEETGALRWVLKLAANEQKKIVLKYTVTCPKDYLLNMDY